MRLIAYALCVLLDVLAFACYDDGSMPGWNCAALPTVIECISAPGVPDDDPPIDLNCPSAARIHAALISVIRRTVRALWAAAYCAPLMRILQYIRAFRPRVRRQRFIFFIYPPRLAPPETAFSSDLQ